ncbi:MAG: hypothetical protein ABEJ58_07780 [Halodesulfurarchaeum sp.]
MRYPPQPSPVSDLSPAVLDSGHFWIQEYVFGSELWFRMESSGLLVFGDLRNEFDPGSIPLEYDLAARWVRDRFDRDRLREGTEDPEAYVFFGVVPLGGPVAYEWESIPPFLGTDIWDGTAEDFLPEDVVERVFDELGLETVPTIEKEVPARRLQGSISSIPDSAWADEKAAGMLLRKKNGPRALIRRDDLEESIGKAGNDVPSSDLASEDLRSFIESGVDESPLSRVDAGTAGDGAHDPIEETVRRVAVTLAREEYTRIRPVLEKRPDEFERIVGERVRSLVGVDGTGTGGSEE